MRPSSEDYTLAYGTHATAQEGRCAMEWVSHLAGEPHTDAPTCVSPVLRALCITLNDGLADGPRQRLRPYLTRTIGTAGDGLDGARAWRAIDWLVRGFLPRWLALAGLDDAAATLDAGPRLLDADGLRAAIDPLQRARHAVRHLAGATFRAQAGPLGGRVTLLRRAREGREAAWACAGAGAWAAARVSLDVDVDAGERVRALCRASAGEAAAVALARLRHDEACGELAGRDARATALGPTLEALAEESIGLLERMLPGVALPLPVPAPAPASSASGAYPRRRAVPVGR